VGRVARFAIWISSKFNRTEIVQLIYGLQDLLAVGNPEVKSKDDFREKHPTYRDFYVVGARAQLSAINLAVTFDCWGLSLFMTLFTRWREVPCTWTLLLVDIISTSTNRRQEAAPNEQQLKRAGPPVL
jgi:hypothetical protein